MNITQAKSYRHIFIVNPNTSRIPVIEILIQRIKNVCREEGLVYEVFRANSPQAGPEHIMSIAKAGFPLRVYICGGDGTVRNIISSTCSFKNIEYGVIPMGTGNDFSRNFGSRESYASLRNIIFGDPLDIDLMKVNGRVYVNMLNIGFDEKVVELVQKYRHIPFSRNQIAYTIAAFIQLIRMPMERVKITFDDGKILDKRFTLCAVANGAYCGGGYFAASNASVNDGLIDVLVVRPIKRKTFLQMIGDYKRGTLLNTPKGKQLVFQKKCVKLTLEKSIPFSVCFDGEIEMVRRLECEIIPKAVKFIKPVRNAV
ncbi:MAG: diacylglycerol kinase family protein [Eubacteriales bacterium]|nr:diacylglycerol kinase family protein [Eubacteriales bacterium]